MHDRERLQESFDVKGTHHAGQYQSAEKDGIVLHRLPGDEMLKPENTGEQQAENKKYVDVDPEDLDDHHRCQQPFECDLFQVVTDEQKENGTGEKITDVFRPHLNTKQ